MGYLQACELLLGKFFNRREEFGLIFFGGGDSLCRVTPPGCILSSTTKELMPLVQKTTTTLSVLYQTSVKKENTSILDDSHQVLFLGAL